MTMPGPARRARGTTCRAGRIMCLLLLLTGLGMVRTVEVLSTVISRRLAAAWVLLFVGAGLLPGWVSLSVF